ncbi:ribonuclease H-like domain-containing protein [Tanacetum coccineum]|uniref:Ribonuclease H-like domain-containing protein n=1 Tax=Tanacetum coccineum TaxID=301880 RepID=A0ABQ5G8D8_9ASTR
MAVKDKPSTLPQIYNHFNRGSCKFEDRCKFIHDHRNLAGLSSQRIASSGIVPSTVGNWSPLFATLHVRPAPTKINIPPAHYQPSPNGNVTPIVYYEGPRSYPTQQPVAFFQQPQPTQYQQYVYVAQQEPVHHGKPGLLGPAPAIYPSQPTSSPSAYSIMTVQDPTWNMDICATSHLISNARNLSTIFNKRLFPSIHVGDSNSIPVTNTRHSIIPSIHRPLHLHNVLVTPNII